MKIFVTAKPKSKKEYVKKIDDENFIVSVKEPPVDDKANIAVIKALAEYFKIPSYQIQIVAGHTGKKKVIEIL
ncbi:MAG TPA: DUF167 domain-containing protein [Candidatus Acidoferrales bacterium]|nr:DUF167 domain-containing protein [Candidatus Acidoferrales bacterium]